MKNLLLAVSSLFFRTGYRVVYSVAQRGMNYHLVPMPSTYA